jgi:D-alanyl-D-alanine carboxypeptidase
LQETRDVNFRTSSQTSGRNHSLPRTNISKAAPKEVFMAFPKQRDVIAFYGNPRGINGNPSPKWMSENLVLVSTPWRLVTSWDGQNVRTFRIHKKCAESLTRVFADIWQAAGENQATIDHWGMNLFGGGFIYRLMRGSNTLSMHSYGCAVDFDPARNSFGDSTPHFANCPAVLKAFAKEGGTWGGRWAKADGMHWQAADI